MSVSPLHIVRMLGYSWTFFPKAPVIMLHCESSYCSPVHFESLILPMKVGASQAFSDIGNSAFESSISFFLPMKR